MKWSWLALILMVLSACIESPEETQEESCGAGEEISYGEELYCVYQQEIHETGFRCPSRVMHLHRYKGFRICSHYPQLPEADLDEVLRLSSFYEDDEPDQGSPNCSDPNPAGCGPDNPCPGEQICHQDPEECLPSSCGCTQDGWACDGDCGGGVCVEEIICEDPNPAGCGPDNPCPREQICHHDSESCLSSGCVCAPDGEWACDDDCGGGICVEEIICEDPNPAGCLEDEDCPLGESCYYNSEICLSSGCVCTPGGEWACDDDCGGGICLRPEQGCQTDADCEAGAEWCEAEGCVPCDNSGEICDLGCSEGFELAERNGCHPCECVPITECRADADCDEGLRCQAGDICFFWCEAGDPSCCQGNHCVLDESACEGPNPAGCIERGCPNGQICVPNSGVCVPSDCACGPDGSWECTEDCGGGLCMDVVACEGPSPAGCGPDNPCLEGQHCSQDPEVCLSSSCNCDPESGWVCDADCGGGVCLPEAGCRSDADCEAGAEWCEARACIPCDNSGELCDLGCPEGFEPAERNGCHPCECVPITECRADADCGEGLRCQAGDLCFFWCEVGDPSCCQGNRCVPDRAVCEGPNPQGCMEVGCPSEQICVPNSGICVPSHCACGPDGSWECTEDCGGGFCVDAGACEGPNPAGCGPNNPCSGGQRCSQDPEVCLSSGCTCRPDQGWICDEDCGGGVCLPEG